MKKLLLLLFLASCSMPSARVIVETGEATTGSLHREGTTYAQPEPIGLPPMLVPAVPEPTPEPLVPVQP